MARRALRGEQELKNRLEANGHEDSATVLAPFARANSRTFGSAEALLTSSDVALLCSMANALAAVRRCELDVLPGKESAAKVVTHHVVSRYLAAPLHTTLNDLLAKAQVALGVLK